MMELAFAQHESGGRFADGGAIEHEAEVLWFDVRAACFQAMRRSQAKTCFVAPKARVDASLYLIAICTHKRLASFNAGPEHFAPQP